MEKQKWNWSFDQWLEDKVWTKVPKEYQSPHYFFLLGFISAFMIMFILSLIF